MNTPKPKRRNSLAVADWPERDRQLWQTALEPVDLFGPKNLAADWKPSTRRNNEYRYGLWLWWLRERGELDTSSSPASRVTQAAVLTYVDHIRKRLRPYSVEGMIRGVAAAMDVLEPDRDWAWLRAIAKNLKAIATMAPKLVKPQVSSDALYGLGLELMDQAASGQVVNVDTAQTFRDGLIISLLAARSILRRGNMAAMALGHNLISVEGVPYVEYSPEETKAGNHIYFPWPEHLRPHLDTYLDVYRRFLLAQAGNATDSEDSVWLTQQGRPMSGDLLAQFVAKRTKRKFDFAVRPHQFRHSCSTTVAIKDPKNVRINMRLLGHSRIEMSEQHYNLANGLEAGREFTRSLRQARKDVCRSKRP